ncbi:MAG: PAS domain-containing sensor histidine kinase [Nitrospirae bacterium]|nr:PAS domain-containing sensor histidine kinase [Nitrospirota bacterium]
MANTLLNSEMASLVISLLSVVIQTAAVAMTLRLIKITENRTAWIFISTAISLMIIRRLENLYAFLFSDGIITPVIFEVIGIVISFFMLVGVSKIAPIFLTLKKSHAKVNKSLSEKELLINELKLTKQLMETVANGITEEIFLITKDCEILWANNAVVENRKCDLNKVVGMHCYEVTHHSDVPCTPPDDPCPIGEFFKTGESVTVSHVHYVNEDTRSFVEVTVYPITNEESIVDKFVHVSKDVTARMLREEEISNLNKMLEQKIKVEVTLREQERQLLIQQSKMAAMGEMIGAITHQWKQPLNIVSLIAQGMPDAYEYGEINREYIKDTVTGILEQVSFMTKTVNDFRNFLKPSKAITEFDIKAAIEDILFMFRYILSKSNIVITFYKDNHLDKFTTTGHPNEFKHVILNLINNSRDAICSMWEKNIMSKDIKGNIHIHLSKDNDKVIITISDNGGGIPKDIIDNIFESYFTTKPDDKGTGIGLYMSKAIIESMGGTITCKNIEGGVEFRINL